MSEEHVLEFEKPIHDLEHKIAELNRHLKRNPKLAAQIEALERNLEELKRKVYAELGPWEKTAIARHPGRPFTLDYVQALFADFIELHGDRRFADDPAIVGGFATFKALDLPVMVIGHQKGRDLRENLRRNFGSANPEGYRKALRLMKLAEKFRLPVITFVDTQGAFPGIGPEERGQAEAIAYNLQKMSSLRTPIVTVVIGEGGSGGALGIAVADVVLMLEHAIYSVISPEGCAAILWKDASKAPEAARSLGITADRLLELGLIDGIVPEPPGGAHKDFAAAAANLGKALEEHLPRLLETPVERLVEERYAKYRRMGEFYEDGRLVSSRRA